MNCSPTATRRLLTVAVIGVFVAGAAFANAPNTVPYAEDFEADGGVTWTNLQYAVGVNGWYGDASDLSQITNVNPGFTSCDYPITDPDPGHDYVLNLNTSGNTLTNVIDMTDTTEALPRVYVDSLVYLVPSEDQPAIDADTGVKAAVYLNSSSNLVVYHGGTNGLEDVYTAIDDVTVLPNTWYRLTITMDFKTVTGLGNEPLNFFQVKLDCTTVLSNAVAFSAPMASLEPDGGSWFRCAHATTANSEKVDAVAYQGTGMIDDLVITRYDPFGGEPPAMYWISTVIGANGTVDGVSGPVVQAVQVGEGTSTQIVFEAAAWYEIATFEENGINVTPAIGEVAWTQVYASVSGNISNDVTFTVQLASDGKTPATWFGPLWGSEPADDGDSLALYDEYLLNSDATVSNEFEITAIGINGSNKPYVQWLSLGPANGTIVVKSTTDLQVAGTPVAGATVHAAGVNTWTGTADANPNAFYTVTITDTP